MPSRLDDPALIRKNDPTGMIDLTLGFPDQVRKALSIALSTELPAKLEGKRNVLVAGMGGSAAGGDLLRAVFDQESRTQCAVWRDYGLPAFASKDTLVFACSYSGDTEETLSAVHQASERGCDLIAITSGGRLADLSDERSFPLFRIPGGQPPRTALGYLFVPLVEACRRLGYIKEQPLRSTISLLESCAENWSPDSESRHNEAKHLAAELQGKLILVYGLGQWQGVVANRWKGQINENAKMMAFANSFPELNHNEIVGWTLALSQAPEWVVVFLESGQEPENMKLRAKVTEELVSGKSKVVRVRARGDTLLEQMLSLTYLGDFVSIYLAALNGVDPESIEPIKRLKQALAKLQQSS